MTSSDRWLAHYSFRLRNLTAESPEEGLDGSFRRMAHALATYETPITFQVQLLDGEKDRSWCLELTPTGSTVQAEKRDHPDFELITHVQTWREQCREHPCWNQPQALCSQIEGSIPPVLMRDEKTLPIAQWLLQNLGALQDCSPVVLVVLFAYTR